MRFPCDRRPPFQGFMKTKLKVTASQVRQSVRKPIPQPTRVFRSRVVFKSSNRKAWKRELD